MTLKINGKDLLFLSLFFASTHVLALENIVHPYQSIRASGMGGVLLNTGLYDENFYGNPARVTANPIWRVQLPNFLMETTTGTISNLGTIVSGGSNALSNLGKTAGKNNHLRIQMTFPGVYIPHEKWSFAFAFLASAQADLDLRKKFDIDKPFAIADVGPAFTVGRKLLENDELSVGLTTHVAYRISGGFTFLDILKGNTTISKIAGEGAHLDFDLGGTYELPWQPLEDIKLSTSAAINNLLGGSYQNLSLKLADINSDPVAQPRTLGFGVAARKAELWKFTDAVLALEFQDIGNNPSGSLFRTVHLGGETSYGVLRTRLGLNQGYIAFGLGLQFKHFEVDFATYGEEMSLNVGGLQDRRLALRLTSHI